MCSEPRVPSLPGGGGTSQDPLPLFRLRASVLLEGKRGCRPRQSPDQEAKELKGDLGAGSDSTVFRVRKIEGSSKGQEGAREEAPRKVSFHSPCGADSLDSKAGLQGGGLTHTDQ